MKLMRAGSQPSQKGPEAWFTGTVRIDPLNSPPEPARATCAYVTFEPGARSAWYPPAGSDADRDRGLWLDAVRRRGTCRNSRRRCHLVPAWA